MKKRPINAYTLLEDVVNKMNNEEQAKTAGEIKDNCAIDREKVIKAIEICCTVGRSCFECPYNNEDDCTHELIRDALVLLQELEPVEPNYDTNGTTCGNCGDLICRFDTYCSTCGRKVKWI